MAVDAGGSGLEPLAVGVEEGAGRGMVCPLGQGPSGDGGFRVACRYSLAALVSIEWGRS